MRAMSVLVLVGVVATAAAAQSLKPRAPLGKSPVQSFAGEAFAHRLVIKFADEVVARATVDGQVVSAAGRDLTAVRQIAGGRGVVFAPLIRLPEGKLADLAARAAARSGVAQPDLAGLLVAEVPGASVADLAGIGNALQSLDAVEFAYLSVVGVPPPGDYAPPTPDLTSHQTYRGANPGVNADYAASHGIDGAGIHLSDCEYGWNATHEDLVDIDLHLEDGQTIHPNVYLNGWDEHGTAVLGETSVPVNGYGCSGMAPAAEVYTYPEWTVEEDHRRETCIANAIANSRPGDVVLLEMQTFGPGGNYGPAELDLGVWTVVKTGTDAGVVVVGAAGNGNQNLDSAPYAEYRSRGDSGAIIVGAGSASTSHDKLSFSTYGTRVNVQGWGESVFAIGYGDYAQYGGDKNQRYTDSFSGTSSASPFVTSAATALQSYIVERTGQPYTSVELRDLLIATGIPQGSGGHIGPFVDMKAAIEQLNLAWVDLGYALAGTHGLPQLDAHGVLGAGDPFTLELTSARENALAVLVAGASAVYLPFAGGTFVPAPDLVLTFLTSGVGVLVLNGTMSPGVPPATTFYLQFWIVDPAGVKGFAASNALAGTTP